MKKIKTNYMWKCVKSETDRKQVCVIKILGYSFIFVIYLTKYIYTHIVEQSRWGTSENNCKKDQRLSTTCQLVLFPGAAKLYMLTAYGKVSVLSLLELYTKRLTILRFGSSRINMNIYRYNFEKRCDLGLCNNGQSK